MSEPVVSVVMSVYNGEKYLAEAVDSILAQTFSALELVVIDDGSSDSSLNMLHAYAEKDQRVRVVENDVNLGLASSLNKGVDLSRGIYVARMDCDDISLPRRLEAQVRFMDSNPDVSMCGTWAKFFGYQSAARNNPTSHDDIRASLLFYTPIFHPSVMFRKSDVARLDHLYEDGRQRVEDLELWARLTRQVRVANIPECLLRYRVYNPQNVEKRKSVIAHGNVIRKAMLTTLLGSISEQQFHLHMKIAHCERNHSIDFMQEAADWLENLLAVNRQNACYNQDSLERAVSERWWRVCKSSTELGPVTHKIYRSRPALRHYSPGPLMTLAWWGKSLVFFKNANHSIHDEELAFVSKVPDTQS
jgi:glycosyltransferase involved in cell wall biosynthesis